MMRNPLAGIGDVIDRLLAAHRPARGKDSPFLGTRRRHVSAREVRRDQGRHRGGRLVQHQPRPVRDPAVAARMAEIRRRPVRQAAL